MSAETKFPCCDDCYFRDDPDVCSGCEEASEFEPAEDRTRRVPEGHMPMLAGRLQIDARCKTYIKAIQQYRYNGILKREEIE